MKYGQLLEYNMRNIFLETSYTKCGVETSPRHFSKISKLSISPDQQSKVLYRLILLYAMSGNIKIYWNYATDYLHLLQIKFKKAKQKEAWN